MNTPNKTNNKAFTLLEIIIVIIIIGVLASLALPRFFRSIEFSYAAEAFSTISSIRASIERCYLMQSDYSQCNLNSGHPSTQNLDIGNIAAPGSHFTYTTQAVTNANKTQYKITATRNTLNSTHSGDEISYTFTIKDNNSPPSIKRTGTGVFSSIK